MQDRPAPPLETNSLAQSATTDRQYRQNSETQAPAIDPIMDECRRTRELGSIYGDTSQISGCTPDGTLVQYRFVDGADRPLVVETINFRDSTHTFTLKNQNIKLVVNNSGRILSYSNGDHLYSFDPKKQTFQDFDHVLPAMDLMGTSTATKPEPKKFESGDGLTVESLNADGTLTYRLPDGLKISFDKYSSLSGIEKENGFKYELDLLHTTKVDPNLPKDHRLRDSEAIKRDSLAAMGVMAETSSAKPGLLYNPIQHMFLKDYLTKNMNAMPEDKRVEYAKAMQAEVDKTMKDRWFYDRMHLNYTVDKAGKLESLDMVFGSYVPYFSIPIEKRALWHK